MKLSFFDDTIRTELFIIYKTWALFTYDSWIGKRRSPDCLVARTSMWFEAPDCAGLSVGCLGSRWSRSFGLGKKDLGLCLFRVPHLKALRCRQIILANLLVSRDWKRSCLVRSGREWYQNGWEIPPQADIVCACMLSTKLNIRQKTKYELHLLH